MSVKDRLKIFIDSQKITISAFEKSIKASNGYVNSINKSIGIDKLENILELYPKLNIEWLFAEKGNMLKASEPNQEENKELHQKITELQKKYYEVLEENRELHNEIRTLTGGKSKAI